MNFSSTDYQFMRQAITLSEENLTTKNGGPFGAVIVKDGKVIASSANQVFKEIDPTAHAEIAAIRLACQALNTVDLSGCIIYSSCEPCPMCLAAIYWSGISEICFANTKEDAAEYNFDDAELYKELCTKPNQRRIPMRRLLREEAIDAFQNWKEPV